MGTGLRLKLLLVVVGIVAVQGPSAVPPGFRQVPTIRSAECPRCGRKSRTKKENQYFCQGCEKPFTPKKKSFS